MATILQCKDIPVLKFNLNEGECDVLDAEHMPFQLRGKLQDIPEIHPGATKYELTQAAIAMNKNNMAITNYFASRVLPLTRENAKKIYNLFGFEQAQDDHSKALIAITCRSVSLQDDYWVKDEHDASMWKDISLRDNSLSETVAQVSLHGTSLTLHGIEHTPELNGQGAYAKAWKREDNGLFLYKLGAGQTDLESKIEVMVSNILDKCNVPHVRYYDAESGGRYACKCKCMTDDAHSILSGMDFISYCNIQGLDSKREALKIDSDTIYKMWVTDYLISNRDRHGMNWGFYYNPSDMQIITCHPLFDHNNAFDKELMKDKDAPYLYDRNMSMKEAALYGIKHTDFHFFDAISSKDFLDPDYYESFLDRAADLGISIQKSILQFPIEKRVEYSKEREQIQEQIKKELSIPDKTAAAKADNALNTKRDDRRADDAR